MKNIVRLEMEKEHAKEMARLEMEKEKKHAKEMARLEMEKEKESLEKSHLKDLYEKEMQHLKDVYELNLKNKEADILRAKGLLTGRGIFERACALAGWELKGKNSTKALDTTTVCNRIAEMMDEKLNETERNKLGENSRLLLGIFEKCQLTSRQIKGFYSILCRDVHGYQWSGDSVKVYVGDLTPEYICSLEQISESFFQLPIDKRASPLV
jgi:NifU-like protein involved in Fe-S cluster formation